VVGAGIGGLCRAHGLLRAGADVSVYERDEGLDSRGRAARLDDVIEFGRTCTGFKQVARGVAVCFRDGPSAHAEILVTADGIGSADYERQMVGYGFAAVRASRGAELATTWRRSAVLRYLISHLPPRNCRTAEPRSLGGRAYRRRISAIVPGRHIP
jgi:2-polyprenyl-6-methoxyphenol hydroxylase-like FAD-dependent oxidoreductase